MAEVVTADLDPDLHRLEVGLRQLKIQYDMFFAGAIPRQPLELRSEIEGIIKRNANNPARKYASRFHFNTLVSRYNAMSELWSKALRACEEGDRPAPAVAHRSDSRSERTLAACTIQDPALQQEVLRVLHERYLEARRRAGEKDLSLPFESFVRGIARQTGKLREQGNRGDVELRVVVIDRKVQLKARTTR